ncbi:SapC family protein [Temperatibacter marinus]|uniref:SapC family protein n=1 Tax=Temperatibacter marinus TaxID=1456591 RepID=A0AA52EFZ7_9PROT|nr:SapC family protein [Temperatibacter marinus]WND04081.1 SapC family protein [Temperatibacter marinus]
MAKLVPLGNDVHRNFKLAKQDIEHLKDAQIIPVVAHEFPTVGSQGPIVFVKNSETGQFQAVLLCGISQGENLFNVNGKWDGAFVPLVATLYPFKILPAGEDKITLGIIEDSPCFSETEGEALFTEDGEMTEFMTKFRDRMLDYYDRLQATDGYAQTLVNHNLLKSQSMNLEINGEKFNIDGLYFIDEEKLMDLADDVVLDFHKRGLMAVMYAQLASMHQVHTLARRKSGK